MSGPLRAETVEVISRSPHTIEAFCKEVGVSRSSYYGWRAKLQGNGPAQSSPRSTASSILSASHRRGMHEGRE
jgi:transposase